MIQGLRTFVSDLLTGVEGLEGGFLVSLIGNLWFPCLHRYGSHSNPVKSRDPEFKPN